MRAKLLVRAMVGAAMAITCGSASAATYCVPAHAGCVGYARTTLAAAIIDANATSEPDDILLAAGHFPISPGVTAEPGKPVRITGAGIDQTFLDGSGAGSSTLSMSGPDQRVSDLTVHGTASGQHSALFLDGATAQQVRADQRDNSDPGAVAVEVRNGGSFLDGEALSSLRSEASTTEGVVMGGSAGQTNRVSNSLVQGVFGVYTSGAGTAIVSRSRITSANAAVYGSGAANVVEDSTVVGGSISAYDTAGDVLMTVRHVTLNAAQIQANESNGHTAHVVMSNTAFVGGGPEFTQVVLKNSTGTARLDADYSFYAGADRIDQNPGPSGYNLFNDGGHNVIGSDAKLVDLGGGDLRPRFDSPLVDVGDPVVADGEPTTDLADMLRTVNGRTDIGAYEYGRHTPGIVADASPRAARPGAAFSFTAKTSDADPGEVAAVSWRFDDGTTATGTSVTHAFATPGPHVATATATDPVGLTATTSTSVIVTAPLFQRPTLAPSFGFTKLTAHKGVVRVRLRCSPIAVDCHGTVAIQLARKPTAKGVAAAKAVVLGKARYSIFNGTTKTIKVKLNRSARRRLARARRGLLVKVVVTPVGAAPRSKAVRLTRR